MTSKFTKTKALKLPAVCHASLTGLPVPYFAKEPLRLSCLASWVDQIEMFAIHESFDLNIDSDLPGWSGSSSATGVNLKVTVERLDIPHEYTLRIILRSDQNEIDDASWHNVKIPQGPPFESGTQRHDYPPAESYDSVTLLD